MSPPKISYVNSAIVSEDEYSGDEEEEEEEDDSSQTQQLLDLKSQDYFSKDTPQKNKEDPIDELMNFRTDEIIVQSDDSGSDGCQEDST